MATPDDPHGPPSPGASGTSAHDKGDAAGDVNSQVVASSEVTIHILREADEQRTRDQAADAQRKRLAALLGLLASIGSFLVAVTSFVGNGLEWFKASSEIVTALVAALATLIGGALSAYFAAERRMNSDSNPSPKDADRSPALPRPPNLGRFEKTLARQRLTLSALTVARETDQPSGSGDHTDG